MDDSGALSSKSNDYLRGVERRVAGAEPRQVAEQVLGLVHDQDEWRAQCINLNPAETLMSRTCRRLLDSDMASRITEGDPGDKLYPHGAANRYFDEIEAILIAYLRKLFGARFVEWRPVSATMASAAVYHGLLRPGDVVLAQSDDAGGNYAYQPHGTIGMTGARVLPISARGDCFEVDLEDVSRLVQQHAPRMIVIGGSNVLFPYPVREIRQLADTVGAIVVYDAAHLGLQISVGNFQRPLEEGAHIVLMTTAKVLAGPISGVVLTNQAELITPISRITFPSLLQKRDMNKAAALAYALAETAQFGSDRAHQTLLNARALGVSLQSNGFEVLGAERDFTNTHQIFVRLNDRARPFELLCNDANIMLTDCMLTGDASRKSRTGWRLAVHEITRLGMKQEEMSRIARLIRRACDGEDAGAIRAEVAALVGGYPSIAYSFDGQGV